jgi:hypothetical protein
LGNDSQEVFFHDFFPTFANDTCVVALVVRFETCFFKFARQALNVIQCLTALRQNFSPLRESLPFALALLVTSVENQLRCVKIGNGPHRVRPPRRHYQPRPAMHGCPLAAFAR